MKISRQFLRVVLAALGALTAAGCNDTTSSCIAACEHIQSCIPDGGRLDVTTPTNCPQSCAEALADGGDGYCTSLGAGYDCIAGLSCPDLLPTRSGGPSPALLTCVQKAGCPGI